MDLRAARRLKPGDWILYGPSMWTAAADRLPRQATKAGRVVHVTSRGGIRVVSQTPDGCDGEREWVPHHHVIRQMGEHERFRA